MNFRLVEIEDLSGPKCQILSVILDDNQETLLEQFFINYDKKHERDVQNIYDRLRAIGNETGARELYFKENEGKPGDGVCALFDTPDKHLRLYCIRYGKAAIILGGGGVKSKLISAWQEDATLKHQATLMIKISKIITQKIKEKEIMITDEGLSGNFELSDE